MDTVRSFQGLDITGIQDYLAKCDKPFETSPLYSTETEETYVDTNRRKSVYRCIVDPKLFNLVEDVMAVINEGNENDEYQYVLWKNGSDITHIKYEEGGFFKRHRDFNSTTSNMIEEFSLIICVTPEEAAKGVEGGETSIVTFGGVDAKPTEKVFDTKTPGCALLFRKDLNHEGKKLTKGVKHIVTANIFAVKKTQPDQVLYVTFPEKTDKELDGDSNTKDSTNVKAAIQCVASDTKSYVLPVSRLTGMLEAHVRFSNAQVEAEGNDIPQVVPFLCHDYTYEQFGVVAKVLNRCYVDEDSIKKEQECLNYFGPFKVENILVDLALEPSSERAEPPQKKQKDESIVKSGMDDEEDDFDADIIVCENEARMKAVLCTARQFGEPYVPFKILFIEGMMQYFDGDDGGYESDAFDIPMTAAAVFVSDHNNLMALWSLDQYRQEQKFTLETAHKCTPFFDCAPERQRNNILNLDIGSKVHLFDAPEFEDWYGSAFKVSKATKDGGTKIVGEDPEEFLRGGMGLGLNVRVSDSELKGGLLKYMFNKYRRADIDPLDLRAGLTKDSDAVHPVNSMFHLDSEGKVCFTRDQAEQASDYIASMNLEERVKASLNKKKFELPQVSEKVSMVYCNDDRYGKMNVLWVCGVLRLDESTKPITHVSTNSTDQQEFDAWPTEAAKSKIEHAKRLGAKYVEISAQDRDLPEKFWEYDSDASTELSPLENEDSGF